jgi:hypothetical protein
VRKKKVTIDVLVIFDVSPSCFGAAGIVVKE